VLDLARRTPVADLEAGFQTIVFGTPAAEGLQENGFRREGRQDQGDVWAAAAPTARLLLRWPSPQPRLAVLDLEPLPGGAGLRAEAALNGEPMAEFVLLEGRRRYAVELPEHAQRPGGNRIRLRFGDPSPDAGRQPSRARLYSLAVGPASDPSLRVLAGPAAPSLLSVVPGDDGSDLFQRASGVLRFALVLPPHAELRFTPSLDRGTTAARVRVTLQEEGGGRRELWAADLTPARRLSGVRLRLPGEPGTPVLLRLHLDSPGGGAVRVVWRAPRVWGSSAAAGQPLVRARAERPAPAPPRELRRALAGSNVLLVVLDAAGARHFGCYGYARATTPEIDRLAAEGVLFERAYTPAAFTYAAIAALWTSQVPDQGQAEWIREGDGFLPKDRMTLAEVLSAGGVRTAGFVANPSAGSGFGLDRGFAEFHELYRAPWSADGMPDAEASSRVLREWLGRAPAGRFFAYVHFREPHYPYAPPPPFDTLFLAGAPADRPAGWQEDLALGRRAPTGEEVDLLTRLYDGNLAYADRELGKIRSELERSGLWEKTVVIVTADHGEAMYEHGWIGHNAQVYEESVRVPLIIRLPGGAAHAPARADALVSLVDVAPTIADVFGLLPRTSGRFRGRSLLAAGGAGASSSVVARTSGATYALVHGRYKLIHDISSGGDELYDLASDPAERSDVAARLPVTAAVYRQALHRWLLDLRGAGASPAPPRLDEEQKRVLRALGYAR
jgi:arylsulfatase A-like enzyme